jgi:hypothetical protein
MKRAFRNLGLTLCALLLLLVGVIACRIAYFKSAGYTQTFTVSEASDK